MADLQEIFKRSQSLLEETSPHLHKPLDNIYHQTKKLYASKPKAVSDQVKGQLLLASQGFDVEKYKRTLSAIDLRSAYEPLEPLGETDIDGYLKHQHDMIVLTAIEETKRLTSGMFEERYNQSLNNDWRAAKRELLQSLSIRRAPTTAMVPYATPAESAMNISQYVPQAGYSVGTHVSAATGLGQRGQTSMDIRMAMYSQIVVELMKHKIDGRFYPLLKQCSTIASRIDDRDGRKRDVVMCWDILRSIVGEDSLDENRLENFLGMFTSPEALNQRHITEKFIKGSKGFLEQQFKEHAKEIVRQFQQQGSPTPTTDFEYIAEYVKQKYKRDSWPSEFKLANNQPVWVMLYHCLRAGLIDDARRFAQNQSVSQTVRQLVNEFDIRDGSISLVAQELSNEYKALLRSQQQDIFEQAVYLVLGAAPDSTNEVFATIEDYLWLKLSIVSERESTTLKSLQLSIRQRGHQYFKKPLQYFRILLLTLQFDEAIEFLIGSRDVDGYQVEAVHFAIALHRYRLLFEPTEQPQTAHRIGAQAAAAVSSTKVNFHAIIHDYVQLFAHTDPLEAVSYFNLIRDETVRLAYITELVIESKDPVPLLGAINNDGSRRRGFLEELLPANQILRIIVRAAEEFHNKHGRYDNAVDLYFMAEELQRKLATSPQQHEAAMDTSRSYIHSILNISNKELSQMLSGTGNRDEVIALVTKVYNKLTQLGLQFNDNETQTFMLLLKLFQFFEYYLSNAYEEAIQYMDALNILPSTQQALPQATATFESLHDFVKAKFPDIILATMRCYFEMSKRYREQRLESKAREMHSRGTTLVTFAGFIQKSMPSAEVFANLLRMEAAMR